MEKTFLSAALMILLVIACLALVMIGINKAVKRTDWKQADKIAFRNRAFAVILAWVVLISALALAGVFRVATTLPPRPVIAVLLALVSFIYLLRLNKIKQLIQITPVSWLVYMQAFRIGVEILLWIAYQDNLIPVQMSWEGYNYDVLTGVLALPAGYLMEKYPTKAKGIGLLFNTIGLLLLLNVLSIAMLSLPTPLRQFYNEPSLTIIGQFPFTLLPGVLVVLAVGLHLFSINQLLRYRLNSTFAISNKEAKSAV